MLNVIPLIAVAVVAIVVVDDDDINGVDNTGDDGDDNDQCRRYCVDAVVICFITLLHLQIIISCIIYPPFQFNFILPCSSILLISADSLT